MSSVVRWIALLGLGAVGILLLRPSDAKAQQGRGPVFIRRVDMTSKDEDSVGTPGSVVGFSCLLDRNGKEQCFVAFH